ncbi:hypothetical protein T03_2809 [Trichinella britovi]|uniref:Uncharacterized protein n=1 Tax=Trichinella britovi TaxID=45882 RepID=A0A0V0ZFS2_TRIBR|nr:hypothetical protein T03_2809 [Trichinella britovi]
MQENKMVTVDLYKNFKADRRTLVFISPGNSHIHETVEKKNGQIRTQRATRHMKMHRAMSYQRSF